MLKINPADCFNPNKTNTSINIVSYGFRIKYCKEFIENYTSKPNYIASNKKIINFFKRTMKNMRQHQEEIDTLFNELEDSKNVTRSILLKTLSKLIQIIPSMAVGPEVLDPIIIEVNQDTLPSIHKVVESYASSPLRPIIILLLDNKTNLNTVPTLLKKFPLNIRVALHNDLGETEILSVIQNYGAESVSEFIDDYASQCFTSCSHTNEKIIINGIDNQSIVNIISNMFIKCHSSLLIDGKTSALQDIKTIDELLKKHTFPPDIFYLFKCINSLNTVYATDKGDNSIKDALYCSNELNNPLITAFVNRFAHFIPDTSYEQKSKLLYSAATEFESQAMIDHKIYCVNNALTYSFYTDNIDTTKFNNLIAEAITNVPGIAGMSILFNNAGTAELYNRLPQRAIDKYKIGLDYATELNRPAQRIGLLGNIAICETLLGVKHSTDYFVKTANNIIHMPNTASLPFIQINGLLNLLAVAIFEANKEAALYIYQNKSFEKILKQALNPQCLGTGSLATQIKIISERSKGQLDFDVYNIPKTTSQISGLRYNYITEHGFNPAIGNAWL